MTPVPQVLSLTVAATDGLHLNDSFACQAFHMSIVLDKSICPDVVHKNESGMAVAS